MRIVLLGHQKWACLALNALCTKHEVLGVITETDSFEAKNKGYYDLRKRFGVYGDLKNEATGKGLPVFQPENINSTNLLQRLNPDLCVSVSYHTKIGKDLLSQFRFINAHGAPLPLYRGRSPISWAIINGETETAVTVHYMEEKIDRGRILSQEFFLIGPNDNSMDVLRNSLPLYPKLILEAIRKVREGCLGRIQEERQSSYFSSLGEEDTQINWASSSRDIHNLVRGAYPTELAHTFYGGKRVDVLFSRSLGDDSRALPGFVYRKKGDKLIVKTGQGSLEIFANENVPLGGRFSWKQ